MQQSTGSLGHSKHRKAFGSKQHKSALNRILLQKQMDALGAGHMKLRERKKPKMHGSVAELMRERA